MTCRTGEEMKGMIPGVNRKNTPIHGILMMIQKEEKNDEEKI